ncbi:MAG: hypothetical protein WB930_08545 [Syntrophobacteraceae bacterium]
MSISAIGSATSVPVNNIASDGDSAAVEAKESTATKLAEQQNGGVAPKAAQASTGKSSSSSNDLARLRMLASQHMSASQIATQLGKSVSAVMQEAAAAGINLSAGSTSTATVNPATGNNVNKTA